MPGKLKGSYRCWINIQLSQSAGLQSGRVTAAAAWGIISNRRITQDVVRWKGPTRTVHRTIPQVPERVAFTPQL